MTIRSAALLCLTGAACAGPFEPGDAGTGIDAGPSPLVDAGVEHCLPAEYLGETLLSLPAQRVNVVRAARCDRYFIELLGPGGGRSEPEVQALRRYDAQLFSTPGVIGLGTSLCCHYVGNEVCYEIDVATHTTPIAELAQRVATVFAQERDRCLAVRLELVGAAAPRCGAADPACVPQPMCRAESPTCCPVLDALDAGAPREPVGPAMLSRGTCAHDGECVKLGVGNHCYAWTEPGFFAPAICYPFMSDAYCGCVAGQCSWYRQR